MIYPGVPETLVKFCLSSDNISIDDLFSFPEERKWLMMGGRTTIFTHPPHHTANADTLAANSLPSAYTD